MSYLLFLDESGHDRKVAPCEVRGGIALHASKIWTFTQRMRGLESRCFGALLRDHGSELKGSRLCERKRLSRAAAGYEFEPEVRQEECRKFLSQSVRNEMPTKRGFDAYAQASRLFVTELIHLNDRMHGKVFAVAIDKGSSQNPPNGTPANHIRRDTIALLQRYYWFLEDHIETRLLVLDETDRADDKRFLNRLERYFSVHEVGKQHTRCIVPTPLFTSSDMAYPIRAADIIIYLVNHGCRFTSGMDAPRREDLLDEWIQRISEFQHVTTRSNDQGRALTTYSICLERNPWPKQ